MKRLIITLLLFAFIDYEIIAQIKTWTLGECISYAIEHSSKVKNQKATNSIYHQDYLEAIGKLLPNINANTSAGFNFGRGVDEETNNYINVNSFSNNYNISASMTLFDGLANYRRVKIGKISKAKGENELEENKNMLAYETMEAYFNVLYNKDMLVSTEEQMNESKKNLQQIQRMQELGLKSEADIAEVEARAAEAVYNFTKQNNVLTISILQLKEKMNFPIDEELIIEKNENLPLITKIPDTTFDIYKKSININPKALIANQELAIRKQNYLASKGSLLPTISVTGGMSSNFFRNMDGSDYIPFSSQIKDKRGEYVSFTLSIPIFNGFSRSASVKRAKAQYTIAQNEKENTLRKLFNDIEQAITDTNGQVDEYEQAIKVRTSAEMAHQINIRKFEEGLIDPILLYTSANRVLKTKAEEYKSKYLYYLKHKLVNYYNGEALYITD